MTVNRNADLEKRPAASPAEIERTRQASAVAPSADIYEKADALVVVVDMPGVDESSVDIRVERNVLTIEGRVAQETHEGYRLAYSEYAPYDYHRAFTLSNEIDPSRIEASIKHGVLRLTLPKAKAAMPRKIDVRMG